MHRFDGHHHHHQDDHNNYDFIQDSQAANAPTFHNSNLIGDGTGKKPIIRACLMVGGLFLLATSLAVALISLIFCPIDGHSIISASVSLAKADDDYYDNTTVFAFNAHIELLAVSKGYTRYGNTTVLLRHPNGTDIGRFPVVGARLAYKETWNVNVPLRMAISRRDSVVSGVVTLQTHVRFSGKVWMFRARPVAEVDCDLVVDVESRTLAYNECETKVSCKGKQRS